MLYILPLLLLPFLLLHLVLLVTTFAITVTVFATPAITNSSSHLLNVYYVMSNSLMYFTFVTSLNKVHSSLKEEAVCIVISNANWKSETPMISSCVILGKSLNPLCVSIILK